MQIGAPMEKFVKEKTLAVKAYDYLRAVIRNMEPGNNKLPSEEELSRSMGISRATVREALKHLSREGAISTIHGKGTFGHPSVLQWKNRVDLHSDYYIMLKKSCKDVQMHVRWQKDAVPSELFSRYFGDSVLKVFSMGWLYMANGSPMLFCNFEICKKYIIRPVIDCRCLKIVSLPQFSAGCMQSTIDSCIVTQSVGSNPEAAREFNLPADTIMVCNEELIYDIDDNLVATATVYAHPQNMRFTTVAHFEA